MPFTPFHWSIAILGLLFFSVFYIPALVVSSSLMDIEGLYRITFVGFNEGHTGFFHTYLGATVIGIVVGFVFAKKRKIVDGFMGLFGLGQEKVPNILIYLSSLLGAWSHIFLDSFLYSKMNPFAPFVQGNIFSGFFGMLEVYIITSLVLVVAFVMYKARLKKLRKN